MGQERAVQAHEPNPSQAAPDPGWQAPPAPGGRAGLLALGTAAGNRAVAAMIQRTQQPGSRRSAPVLKEVGPVRSVLQLSEVHRQTDADALVAQRLVARAGTAEPVMGPVIPADVRGFHAAIAASSDIDALVWFGGELSAALPGIEPGSLYDVEFTGHRGQLPGPALQGLYEAASTRLSSLGRSAERTDAASPVRGRPSHTETLTILDIQEELQLNTQRTPIFGGWAILDTVRARANGRLSHTHPDVPGVPGWRLSTPFDGRPARPGGTTSTEAAQRTGRNRPRTGAGTSDVGVSLQHVVSSHVLGELRNREVRFNAGTIVQGGTRDRAGVMSAIGTVGLRGSLEWVGFGTITGQINLLEVSDRDERASDGSLVHRARLLSCELSGSLGPFAARYTTSDGDYFSGNVNVGLMVRVVPNWERIGMHLGVRLMPELVPSLMSGGGAAAASTGGGTAAAGGSAAVLEAIGLIGAPIAAGVVLTALWHRDWVAMRNTNALLAALQDRMFAYCISYARQVRGLPISSEPGAAEGATAAEARVRELQSRGYGLAVIHRSAMQQDLYMVAYGSVRDAFRSAGLSRIQSETTLRLAPQMLEATIYALRSPDGAGYVNRGGGASERAPELVRLPPLTPQDDE